MIPLEDRGFTLGDGVFETVLADSGRLVCFGKHLARMAEGAVALGLPPPQASEARSRSTAALAGAGLDQARAAVRLAWTAGSGGRGLDRPERSHPRLTVSCAPAIAARGPARLYLSSVRRNEGSPASRHKTLAYLDNVLARREARAAGADEAIMLNNAGALACCAAANLFWVQGGRLFTPALNCGVLAGLVRAQVLNCAAVLGVSFDEVVAAPEALAAADAVFITNSLIGVRFAEHPLTAEGEELVRALADAVEALRSSCR